MSYIFCEFETFLIVCVILKHVLHLSTLAYTHIGFKASITYPFNMEVTRVSHLDCVKSLARQSKK